MPRPKGSRNKLTKKVKEHLEALIEEVIDTIDVDDLVINEKLKLLQLSMHYVIPKLRSTYEHKDSYENMPLFIDVSDGDK